MLTIQDKTDIQVMIDESMTRNLSAFKKESEHYMGSLVELIRDDIKKVIEICNSKPDRDEVREIIQEEVKPIRQEMRIFKEEIMLLREDSNRHENNIQRLKLKHV